MSTQGENRENQESEIAFVEYLYGEMSPTDAKAFRQSLEKDPELEKELQRFVQLRKICEEHLSEVSPPKFLQRRLFEKVGLRRQPWYETWRQSLLRPAFAGAAVFLLTLGIAYRYKTQQNPQVAPLLSSPVAMAPGASLPPAVVAPSLPENAPIYNQENESRFSDLLLANQPMPTRLQMPTRQAYSAFSSPNQGTVSLASYGSANNFAMAPSPRGMEVHSLDQEVDRSMAQFLHKQALRMRAMGDPAGAAQELARVIRSYPAYPLRLQAQAQRIDCLFQAGDMEAASNELVWLGTLSPDLAYAVGKRWLQ